jgi:hypothetical protein
MGYENSIMLFKQGFDTELVVSLLLGRVLGRTPNTGKVLFDQIFSGDIARGQIQKLRHVIASLKLTRNNGQKICGQFYHRAAD